MRHLQAQPARNQYASALRVSRRVCFAGRPPGVTAGISGRRISRSGSNSSVE
jgi:hypothetical protein